MPIYDFQCSNCDAVLSDVIMTVAEREAFCSTGVCKECQSTGTMRSLIGSFKAVFGKGSHTHEIRTMEQRYKRRNERLDSLPKEHQSKISEFMKRHNVRATPPAYMPDNKNKPRKQTDD